MEYELEIFTNYVRENYDLSDKVIYEKYEHSIRVWTLMINLGLALNLGKDDLYLASFIGLFHDLGRFREVVRNKDKEKKLNNLSFDHGAYSNKILFNDGLIHRFNVKEEDYLLIKKANFFHNKKDLGEGLTEKEKLFCQMIRDVDKLDLLFIRSSKRKLVFNGDISKIVLANFLNNQTIDIRDLKTDSDRVIFYLSFIKELTFDECFNFAIMNGYLERLISVFDIQDRELFSLILKEVEERGKKNDGVKEKIRSLGSRKK